MTWLKSLPAAYRDTTVLVTGHTGFKGAWLCEWLLGLGARVVGVSLPPPTEPCLFDQLGLSGRLDHRVRDIRDVEVLREIVLATRPDDLFHLAAQPLVRASYRAPVETYAVNFMGTVHVLESLRTLDASYAKDGRTCAAILVTTDKVYENRGWEFGYREGDSLGGHDPYSSSKAAAEIAIASFRSSFLSPARPDTRVGVASARAGNVIGGGDWGDDRILPDCIRSLSRGRAIAVRNPRATRPWQHVLEPLGGYLLLAWRLREALRMPTGKPRAEGLGRLASPFNFGPSFGSNRPVQDLVLEVLKHWPGEWRDASDPSALHEASLLNLAPDKAFHGLGWQSHWGFEETVARTMAWYRKVAQGGDAGDLARNDIAAYMADVE